MKRTNVSGQKKIEELKTLYMATIKAGQSSLAFSDQKQSSLPFSDEPPPGGG